jgi:putative sigma-54 modulation protein
VANAIDRAAKLPEGDHRPILGTGICGPGKFPLQCPGVRSLTLDAYERWWRNFVQVNVSARHGHLKQVDQQLITEKAEKVRKFYDRINAIEVTVDLEHLDKPHVEINVSAESSPDFIATATAPSILAALDAAIQKVEQQVRKHKEKVTDHKGVGPKHHSDKLP